MTTKKQSMTKIIADRLLELFEEGDSSPTIKQVLSPLRNRKQYNLEDNRWIRSLLGRAKDKLESEYEVCVCFVNSNYYEEQECWDEDEWDTIRESYKDRPPESDAEALACLPIGPGKRISGVYFPCPDDGHDLIYKNYVAYYAGVGSSQTSGFVSRAFNGISSKVLNNSKTQKALKKSISEGTSKNITPLLEKLVQIQADTMQLLKKVASE